VSEEYQVYDRTDTGAGTHIAFEGVVVEQGQARITLVFEDLLQREHTIDLTFTVFREGTEVGTLSTVVTIPFSDSLSLPFLIPFTSSLNPGDSVRVRVSGTDSLGDVSVEGDAKVITSSQTSSPVLISGFVGLFVLLAIIFLIVKHSLTRAHVQAFAASHSQGLISLR
jgi:hypothetical protein